MQWIDGQGGEIFTRMLREGSYDAAEMSLAYMLRDLDRGGERALIGVPAFPWRAFRQSFIYVRSDGPVQEPCDLEERVFAVTDIVASDALWIRGLLADYYGVDVRKVRWLQFRDERRMPQPDLSGWDLAWAVGADPEELLRSGQADAVFTPGTLPSLVRGEGWVRPLFADTSASEKAFVRESGGLFPILHTFVVRRDVYEQEPGVARQLYAALLGARDEWYRRLESPWTFTGLPWLRDTVRETRALLDEDFWSYGLAKNERVLRLAIEYYYRDGLLSRRYEPAELFAAELHDT